MNQFTIIMILISVFATFGVLYLKYKEFTTKHLHQ